MEILNSGRKDEEWEKELYPVRTPEKSLGGPCSDSVPAEESLVHRRILHPGNDEEPEIIVDAEVIPYMEGHLYQYSSAFRWLNRANLPCY